MTKKLQHIFALSEKGARDLVKAVIWCFVCNLALMFPVGAVLFTVQHLLGCLEGGGSPTDGFWLYVGFALAVLVLLFVLHWFQYASLYIATYRESANRRVSLAETLRRLPLSFFGNRDLSDLTSTMIADCSSLDQMFSHYVPQLFASVGSTLVIGVCMFACDWRMALAVLWVVPVAVALTAGSKKIQDAFGTKNILNKRAVADCIQEGLETIRDIKACHRQERYLGDLEAKLSAMEGSSIRSELATGVFVCSAQAFLRLGLATTVLTGSAPVEQLRDYGREVAAYTRGRGRLACEAAGYRPCRNAQEVMEAIGYDPRRDIDNPADSVFCAHGAGYTVPWDQVPAMAHVSSGLQLDREEDAEEDVASPRRAAPPPPRSKEEEAELTAIFERTYGQVKRREPLRPVARPVEGTVRRTVPDRPQGPEYLLVDGYNIIFAWDELKELARVNLESARRLLMDLLCNYQGFKKCVVILVFDAYKVKGNPGSVERWHNIYVVYTREAETADTYIERATYEIARDHRVRVATSDSLEQLIILGHGAVRLSAREFKAEMEAVEGSIREIIARNNRTRGEDNTLRRRVVIKGKTGGTPGGT